MKIDKADDKYIEKAKNLSKEEVERLQSRMRKKLTRRSEDKELTKIESLAIQIELEDEELAVWRDNRRKLNAKLKS